MPVESHGRDATLAAGAGSTAGAALFVNARTDVLLPQPAALAGAGVARLSIGCGPMQATLALTRRIAETLRDAGTYDAFTADALPKGEVDRWFAPAG